MKIIAAFAKRRSHDIPHYFPELITAVDEGTMDVNPGFFQEELRRVTETWGDELEAIRVFEFDFPVKKLEEAFDTFQVEINEVYSL